jgi:hypothetical protein
MDEVGRGSNDDAEDGWGLKQEAWMGGDLWRLDFTSPTKGTSGRCNGRQRGGQHGEHSNEQAGKIMGRGEQESRPVGCWASPLRRHEKTASGRPAFLFARG